MSSPRERAVKVLLADDHRLLLNGVRTTLERTGEFEVVGEAVNGSEALVQVRRTRPDVVLLDLRMPGMDGLTCLGRIKQDHPDIKVIVLSVSTDEKLIETAIGRGASAYVVKSIASADLPEVIRQVIQHDLDKPVGLPEDTAAKAARDAGLSRRELVVLTAVAHGKSNATIADELCLARQTVKFHLSNIYRKLQVASRTQAVRYAYQHGLVESPIGAGDSDDPGRRAG